MITLSVLLVFVGFFALYLGSNRVEIEFDIAIIQWFRSKKINAKGTGIAMLLIAMLLSVQIWGLGAGVLFFFIQLMTVGSIIVLLTPLHVFNYKFVSTLAVVFFLIEFLSY